MVMTFIVEIASSTSFITIRDSIRLSEPPSERLGVFSFFLCLDILAAKKFNTSMKLSQIIQKLQKAKDLYGDVDGIITDHNGVLRPVVEIIKVHPFNGPHGCMNRNDPVKSVEICYYGGNAPDLIID